MMGWPGPWPATGRPSAREQSGEGAASQLMQRCKPYGDYGGCNPCPKTVKQASTSNRLAGVSSKASRQDAWLWRRLSYEATFGDRQCARYRSIHHGFGDGRKTGPGNCQPHRDAGGHYHRDVDAGDLTRYRPGHLPAPRRWASSQLSAERVAPHGNLPGPHPSERRRGQRSRRRLSLQVGPANRRSERSPFGGHDHGRRLRRSIVWPPVLRAPHGYSQR